MSVWRPRTPDEALLRRASLTVAVQTAAAVAVVVVVVTLAVFVVFGHQQNRAAVSLARSAAVLADDVQDPPAGALLVQHSVGGTVTSTKGTPAAVTHANLDGLAEGSSQQRFGDGTYATYTTTRSDGTRYVGLVDLRAADERERLVTPLVLGGVLGVLAAALVGGLIGLRAARPLAAALSLQRRFVADASHELRTPLTIVHTRAQMLRRRADPGDRRLTDGLDELLADTRSLGEVVDDLLLSASLEHHEGRRAPVAIAELSREVARRFAPSADERGLRLDVQAADEAYVLGVSSALRRAVGALVDNGLSHAAGTVRIAVSADRTTVRVSVADDGGGFEGRTEQELLGRFVRGATQQDNNRRFGLGLALVDEVVRAHGGTLELVDQAGGGAVVTICLPRAAGPASVRA